MFKHQQLYTLLLFLFSLLSLNACAPPADDGTETASATGLSIALYDLQTNQTKTQFLETEDAGVLVVLKDESGVPLANQIVDLSVSVGGALLSQSSVLTNSEGVATAALYSPDLAAGSQPGSVSATAAGYSSEAYNYEFIANNVIDPDTVPTGIQLQMTRASDGVEENSISIEEVANLAITLYDLEGNVLPDEIINLTATSGTLSQDKVLTDDQGRAVVTIDAPEDLTFGTAPGTVTASSNAVTQDAVLNYEFVATTQVDDEEPVSATSIRFDSVSQEIISLKGTGTTGFGESSQVAFTVLNGATTVANAQVNFTLTTSVGGIAFNNGSSTTSAVSDAQGQVAVTVHAGNIATPVRVTAFIELENGDLVFVQSNIISITSGVPDQNSLSLSFDKFAAEGANYDGDTITVTARLADRFNNPVPQGTAVNFTTEGGKIEGSCITDENSQCSVLWESQNPRPADHRSTVMAHVIGHETYYDENGSGIFDDIVVDGVTVSDEFDDLTEAFRDDDENGVFDPDAYDETNFANTFSRDEIFIDYDESGNFSLGDGVYNGVPCEHSTDCPVDANNLAGRSNSLTSVRSQGLILMATSFANIEVRLIDAGERSCLDANGKIRTDICSQVSGINFPTGANTQKLWILIEDSTALCTTAQPDYSVNPYATEPAQAYFTRVDAVDPDDPACTFATRQSAATGSSIEVGTDVGELSEIPVTAVLNTYGPLEFVAYLSSADANSQDLSGSMLVKVTSPQGNVSSASLGVFDPAN